MDHNNNEQNGAEVQEAFKRKCLTESGLAFSSAAFLSILISWILSTVGYFVAGEKYSEQNWFRYLGYFGAQAAFAGAAAIYFFRSRDRVRAPFSRCKARYFLIALVLQFGLLFSLSDLNGLFLKLFEKLGYQYKDQLPNLSGWNLLPAIFVIAVLPAVFEELIFRGILARNMHREGWGLVPVLLLSGAMFSLFHGNPAQTVYQFICGICFSLVAIRAGSILPTMLAHFCNNLATLITISVCGVEEWSDALPFGGYLTLVITSAVCLLGALAYLIFFDRRGNQKGGVKDGLFFFLAAGGGILLCVVEWIAALVMGFINA